MFIILYVMYVLQFDFGITESKAATQTSRKENQ